MSQQTTSLSSHSYAWTVPRERHEAEKHDPYGVRLPEILEETKSPLVCHLAASARSPICCDLAIPVQQGAREACMRKGHWRYSLMFPLSAMRPCQKRLAISLPTP